MRKLFYIFGIIFILMVVNFTMWFVHTRTIHNSVSVLRKQLALYKIDLVYEDLYFSSFKSWNVSGIASNVKLRVNSKNPHIIAIDRINIFSNPFKEHVELQTEGGVKYIHRNGAEDNIYDIKFHNGSPAIEVFFLTSLDSFSDSLDPQDDETPHALRNIKSIKYYDSGFDLFDVAKKANYASFEGNKFALNSHFTNASRKYDITFDVKGMKFDPTYPSIPSDAKIDKINIDSGLSSLHLDVSMLLQPSEHQLELIQKIKEKDKDAEVKKVLDSFLITFNNIVVSTELIKTTVTGTLDKQPSSGLLPYMNINLGITDFNKCADIYFASLNHSIEKMVLEQPLIPIKTIAPEQISKFKKFVSQFSDDGKDLNLKLVRTKEIDFNISGRPIADIMNELQATFFSNFGMTSPNLQPKSDIQNRLSKVAK